MNKKHFILYFIIFLGIIFFISSLLSVRFFDGENQSFEMFFYVFYLDLIFCFFYFILNSFFLFFLKSKKDLFSNYFILLETSFALILVGLIMIGLDSGREFIFSPYFIFGIIILFFSILLSYLITKPNNLRNVPTN